MTTASAAGTISLQRVVKIVVIAAAAFAAGFFCMSMVNGVGYLLSAGAGAHPTGRGNLPSQVIAGALFAVIGAAIAIWRTNGEDNDPYAIGVSLRAVGIVLIAATIMPIALWLWNNWSANNAERQQFLAEMANSESHRASWGADSLAHTPGGVSTLRDVLFDAGRPMDMRLLAGLELGQWLVDPPADVVAQMDQLIAQPGPVRNRFVELHAAGPFVTWPAAYERWMLVVLDDPDPKIRFASMDAMVSHAERPRPQWCAVLKQLARDGDQHVRSEAMLRTTTCPDDQLALLKEGARDPEAVVRAAVLKRLGWRLIIAPEDTIADIADRLSVADMLVDDPDPSVRDAAVKARDRLRGTATTAKP